MEREPFSKDNVFADIWRASQERRAEDMSVWLRTYFRQLRTPPVAADDIAHPEGHPAF
jgi:hypothetical protein